MNNNRFTTVLLATFTTNAYLDSSLRRVFHVFRLDSDRIFAFNDLDNKEKKILTYNVKVPSENGRADISKVFHTICINRKKESNTLYTINSLNKLVEQETGEINPRYQVDWSKYENMMITLDRTTDEVVFVQTEFHKVFYKNEYLGQSGQSKAPTAQRKVIKVDENKDKSNKQPNNDWY